MGITGLLPLLKSIQRPTDLQKFSGETLAVDAYGWLHRAAFAYAMDLGQGKHTRRFVTSAINRVRMVQSFGVTPYLVFDGDYLPSKAATEEERAKRREESRKAGEELLKAGHPTEAVHMFRKAIDITPDMACELIRELKKLGIPYVVAPYEADAQMVYLERQGLVSGILSEDSDLLVFGAKRLITKLDNQGRCVEINRRDFCACREVALTDFSDAMFRHMAILSGCDYLDGIGNLGLKTAYRMLRQHKTVEKVVRMAQFQGKFKVSENYLASFRQAELTFLYQRVFCPLRQELVFLTEPNKDDDRLDLDSMLFLGRKIDNDVARAVAVGDMHPITKEPIVLPETPSKTFGSRTPASTKTPNPRTPASISASAPLGQPIDAYFSKKNHSAQRVPLGAMDPNCFTVDKEEVAALTQNGLAPRVFPLPRPYVHGGRTSLPATTVSDNSPRLRRRRTEPLSSMVRQMSGGVRTATTTARAGTETATSTRIGTATSTRTTTTTATPPPTSSPRPRATSSARPPKKARLSQDSPSPEKNERSKFFPVSPPKSRVSPTTAKEPYLMSDDSVEEAMMILSDLDGWNSNKTPAVHIYSDGELGSGLLREETASKGEPSDEPPSDGIEVPVSPDSSISTQPERTPLSRTSLNRFAYAPGVRMAHGLPTPSSSFQGSSGPGSARSFGSSRSFQGSSLPRLTPPSSISNRRPSRPKKTPTTPKTTKTTKAAKPSRSSLADLVRSVGGPLSSSSSSAALSPPKRRIIGAPLPVNASFVPLPKADMAEVEALSQCQGSEDQIIPDSGGEEEEEEEELKKESRELKSKEGPTRLDLSRFLCV